MKPKCLQNYWSGSTPPRFYPICALHHFNIATFGTDWRQFGIEFDNIENGILPLIHIKSSCSSPFLGDYVGTVTPGRFWMNLILRGKELIIDRQREEVKYPEQVPLIFRSAPVEDYKKEVCNYLCQYQQNISWESFYDYQLNTCETSDLGEDRVTKHHSCSLDDCHDETAFASTDFYVELLRLDETNLSVSQLRKQNVMGNNTKIYIKSDSNFFTVRNINVEKTFQEFLAEIGGNLGLFAGASILTLVEFGEFFTKIIKEKVFSRPRRNNKVTTYPVPAKQF